jgi:hypothetical protein
MRLNPSLPLSDSFQARLAAQAILRNQFDMKEAVAELRLRKLKSPTRTAASAK